MKCNKPLLNLGTYIGIGTFKFYKLLFVDVINVFYDHTRNDLLRT